MCVHRRTKLLSPMRAKLRLWFWLSMSRSGTGSKPLPFVLVAQTLWEQHDTLGAPIDAHWELGAQCEPRNSCSTIHLWPLLNLCHWSATLRCAAGWLNEMWRRVRNCFAFRKLNACFVTLDLLKQFRHLIQLAFSLNGDRSYCSQKCGQRH